MKAETGKKYVSIQQTAMRESVIEVSEEEWEVLTKEGGKERDKALDAIQKRHKEWSDWEWVTTDVVGYKEDENGELTGDDVEIANW